MTDEESAAPSPGVDPRNEVPPPSGAGVVLDDRPSVARQFAFSVLLGVAGSAFMAAQLRSGGLATTPAALGQVFFITLATFTVLWLAVLGFRTLDRRRLLRRFPGTLVFSFRQTSEVVNVLRQLNAFAPGRRDFDIGSVETVADLRGLTFWQRNPPEMYASLPWSKVENLQVGRQTRQQGARTEATVDVRATAGDESVEMALFGVDASMLPLPTRREVEWAQRQLAELYRRSTE